MDNKGGSLREGAAVRGTGLEAGMDILIALTAQ